MNFKKRKFARNFNKFKTNLKSLKDKVLSRGIITWNNVFYNVFGYEKNGNELEIQAWDLMNYDKFEVVVSKALVGKTLQRRSC